MKLAIITFIKFFLIIVTIILLLFLLKEYTITSSLKQSPKTYITGARMVVSKLIAQKEIMQEEKNKTAEDELGEKIFKPLFLISSPTYTGKEKSDILESFPLEAYSIYKMLEKALGIDYVFIKIVAYTEGKTKVNFEVNAIKNSRKYISEYLQETRLEA